MIRLAHLTVVGGLLLLSACADANINPPQLSQADLDRQSALNACQSAADAANRPLVPNDNQLFSRPGEPRYPGQVWQAERSRSVADCMAKKGYADYKANVS